MNWLKKKLDPTALGSGIGSTLAATVAYLFDLPLSVAVSAILVVGYFVGHFFPNKENQDHGVDLSGGDD